MPEDHPTDKCVLLHTQARITTDPSTGIIKDASPEAVKLLVKDSTPDTQIAGKFIHDYFQTQNSENNGNGLSLTELNALNSEEPKLIYTCVHRYVVDDQPVADIWFLDDIFLLKNEYSKVQSHALKIEQIGHITTPLPEFIIRKDFKVGDNVSFRLNKMGKILQMYPVEKYLDLEPDSYMMRYIMEFVAVSDHPVLTQGLAEAYKFGQCIFLVKWSPNTFTKNNTESFFNTKWVIIKAQSDEEFSKDKTVTCSIQSVQQEITPTAILNQAWDTLSKPFSVNWFAPAPNEMKKSNSGTGPKM
ncbi:hypothetical protein HDV01_007033 [Terramyces sp. JEL0728]|nr:hypothetical protein HDV01_007033 [Terramyces sp. JEL0728]